MTENVRVRASRLFQCVREDREPPVVQRARGQVSLVVGSLGEANYGGVVRGQDR